MFTLYILRREYSFKNQTKNKFFTFYRFKTFRIKAFHLFDIMFIL